VSNTVIGKDNSVLSPVFSRRSFQGPWSYLSWGSNAAVDYLSGQNSEGNQHKSTGKKATGINVDREKNKSKHAIGTKGDSS